jgi:hypothetical protein
MKEFDIKLKQALKNLPLHEPQKGSWNAIEKRLDFNDKLRLKIEGLPVYKPNENLWQEIEPGIRKEPKLKVSRYIISGLSVAATILILIVLKNYMFSNRSEKITVTEEIVNEWKKPLNTDSDIACRSAVKFINKQCSEKSYLCDNPVFNSKKKELDNVETQIKTLQNIISTSGSNESLIKSNIKLENLRARLMKDLLKIVSS